ncbi:MAG: alpha/beta hydrolase [Vicinamibacterales bacterium]
MTCPSSTSWGPAAALPIAFAALTLWLPAPSAPAGAAAPQPPSTATITLRGHVQTVRLYGPSRGMPVVVSSGDGGWVHLGPHVAEVLAGRGAFVVGFDAKAYLASFTSAKATLTAADEPADFRVLATYASAASGRAPILIGVSEGAGLSILAATDPATKAVIRGVIGLGLPDINELGWRWRDSLIYLTHGVPNEPTFSAAAIVDRVGPLPFAAIHSSNDEFVPVADVERIFARAGDPKRLWIVRASNHRFEDNLAEFDARLIDAVRWIEGLRP